MNFRQEAVFSTGCHHSEKQIGAWAPTPSPMICFHVCLLSLMTPPEMYLPEGLHIVLFSILWPSPGCPNYSLHILLFDSQINFLSSAFALAASSEFRLLLYSLPTALHLCFMLVFNSLIDLLQILILLAMPSRMLPIVCYHLPASCSTASAVHSTSRWALCFASSILSFSTASMFSPVIAAKFHPTTHS